MTQKPLKIRKARLRDCEEIHSLRKTTFAKINAKDYTKKQIDWLNKKNTPKKLLAKMQKRDMFCLVKGDEILGVIDIEKNKIGGLFIKQDCIGKGFGIKLMKFIEDYARKKGVRKAVIYSTKYAYPFYLKQDYKLVKRLRGTKVPLPAIKMEKYLK